MPLKIQDPGPGSKLQRLFKLVGLVRPVLEESIIPVVLLDDLTSPNSADRIVGGAKYSPAGGVGDYSWVELGNPAGSGKLLLVDAVVVRPDSTSNLAIKVRPSNATLTDYTYYRDGEGAIATALMAAVNLPIVPGAEILRYRGLSASPATIIQLYHSPVATLTPGTSLMVACQTDNVALTASFGFRERDLP